MLETRYPLLFNNSYGERLLARTGLEIGPGWMHIADAFCSQACADVLAQQSRFDRAVSSGKSASSIAALRDELTEAKKMLPLVLFKEKFGALRIQMVFPALVLEDDAPMSPACAARFEAFRVKLSHASGMASAVAARACEMCGRHGTLRDEASWHVTLCEEHALLMKSNPVAYQAAWTEARRMIEWL